MTEEELKKQYNEDLKKENNRLKVGIKTKDLDSLKRFNRTEKNILL